MSDGGKGSAPRPFSVTQDTYSSNWELIFGSKMNKRPVRLTNPLNKEQWLCDEYDKAVTIEGVAYVKVYKPENPDRTHLMRKDALRKLTYLS